MNEKLLIPKSKWLESKRVSWLVGAAAVLVIGVLAGQFLTLGVDWYQTYRPATLMLLSGQSPYNTPALKAAFANAPWALLPMIPLALLPPALGRGLYFAISLAAFAVAAYRLGARPPALLAFLLSPVVWHCLLNANVDWMPLLGFGLPPQLGLFLVLVKPQMGYMLALFWLVEAWRSGGIKEVLRVFAPVSLAFLLSFLIFGPWLLDMRKVTDYTTWNASLWPVSIPVGLTLVVAAIRTRQAGYAMAASPCLSPYVLFHSWASALIALAPNTVEMITASLGLWALVLYRAFFPGG